MKQVQKVVYFLVLGGLIFQSCGDQVESVLYDYTDEEYALISETLNIPYEVYSYSTKGPVIDREGSTVKPNFAFKRRNHKATLGRVLFYDTKLSINESITCASCHKQELAFADDVAFSEGFDGQVTIRNSLPLGNTVGFETAYGGPGGSLFAWDEANIDISSQSKAAIISEIEMGMDMGRLVDRIDGDDVYSILFSKAYGDTEVFEHRILESISEFVNKIVSNESRFDHEFENSSGNLFLPFAGYTSAENQGKALYLQKCSNCHSKDHGLTFVPVANNGLDQEYEDKGLGGRTMNTEDNGVFKVPFLRNIELTAPYMHDGRFSTLREVIDHYSEGIADHPNLDPKLKEFGEPMKMNFSEEEKNALEAYLKTLTDTQLIADEKFSDPFKL